MKFLKMYATMNGCNDGQMVVGMETPIVDISTIHSYVVKDSVYDTKFTYVGNAIRCSAKNKVFYASPPINRNELYRDIQGLGNADRRGELDDSGKSELETKEKAFRRITAEMEKFIPFMIRAFAKSEDGVILRIVVKNDEWELEEV